jgi:hypothetical protein
MATYYWTDAGTDMNVLAGWNTARDGSGSAATGTDLTNATHTFIIERGDRDLTSAVAIKAAVFRVTSGSRNRLGTAGTPAQIRGAEMQFQGGGTSYVDVNNASGTTVATCNIRAVSTGGSLLSLTASTAATVAQLDVGPSARVQAASSVTVTAYNNAGGSLTLLGTSLTNGAPAVTTGNSAGTTNLTRQVATNNVLGGITTDASPPLTGGSATAITALSIDGTGTYVDQNGKDITTVTVFPNGTYNGSGVTGNKTVATLNQWAGANVTLRGQGGTVTVTTTTGVGLP